MKGRMFALNCFNTAHTCIVYAIRKCIPYANGFLFETNNRDEQKIILFVLEFKLPESGKHVRTIDANKCTSKISTLKLPICTWQRLLLCISALLSHCPINIGDSTIHRIYGMYNYMWLFNWIEVKWWHDWIIQFTAAKHKTCVSYYHMHHQHQHRHIHTIMRQHFYSKQMRWVSLSCLFEIKFTILSDIVTSWVGATIYGCVTVSAFVRQRINDAIVNGHCHVRIYHNEHNTHDIIFIMFTHTYIHEFEHRIRKKIIVFGIASHSRHVWNVYLFVGVIIMKACTTITWWSLCKHSIYWYGVYVLLLPEGMYETARLQSERIDIIGIMMRCGSANNALSLPTLRYNHQHKLNWIKRTRCARVWVW